LSNIFGNGAGWWFHGLSLKEGHLTASTLFVTFDITDLYTMLPQEEALAILAEFLHEHGCEKVEKISIDTIVQLARLVLQENVFVYDKKYYRQIIGGQYVRERQFIHSDKHRSKKYTPRVGIEPISQILVIQTGARTTELSRHTSDM
jgi:hypothetical protein